MFNRVTRRGGAIAAVMLLAAAAAGSQAGSARAAVSTIEVSYIGNNGHVFKLIIPAVAGGTPSGVPADLGFAASPGTSPSAAVNNSLVSEPGEPPPTTDQVAASVQIPGPPPAGGADMLFLDPWPLANEGDGATGVVYDDTTLPMAPGTSPAGLAIAAGGSLGGVTSPTYVVAINSGNAGGSGQPVDHLQYVPSNPDTGQYAVVDTGLVMASGTSPAMATSFQGATNIVYEGANGHLSDAVLGVNSTDWNIPMAPGTSPALAAENGGWAAAFQAASDPQLGISSDDMVMDHLPADVFDDSGMQMAPGTSPAIATSGSSVKGVAFQDPNHQLIIWFDNGQPPVTTGVYLAPRTSPTLISIGASWIVAYQDQSNVLWFYSWGAGPAGTTNQPMAPGTSPSFASPSALPG